MLMSNIVFYSPYFTPEEPEKFIIEISISLINSLRTTIPILIIKLQRVTIKILNITDNFKTSLQIKNISFHNVLRHFCRNFISPLAPHASNSTLTNTRKKLQTYKC